MPLVPPGGFRIVEAGDSALVVEFEDRVDPGVNARAIACARAVAAARHPGVRDVVPTYRAVAVYFDPLRTDLASLGALLEREGAQPAPAGTGAQAPIEIPVCYGGTLGPDLAAVARHAGCSEDEVVERHTSQVYRVYMLGFIPGFAYLGLVDERIAMPRHATPRVKVPARSVGIAGRQTGIYPSESPGGWQLIGRTPIAPFDPTRPRPFLMQAGDAVKFVAIAPAEYARLAGETGTR
ncbi:MAG: 5-oxoprolinase subunit PxpB [Acidobacteriota bacterium]|nr:5-oxoprolinase subunit PxpB [Acidobacteriota bacterium]